MLTPSRFRISLFTLFLVLNTTLAQAQTTTSSQTSWFTGDTTGLNPSNTRSGAGVAIDSAPTYGYVFAYDYAANGTRDLGLNRFGCRVAIGTSTPDQTLTVNGNASKPGGGSWATFSDERLKTLRGRFTPGLAAVMQLQPLRYQYKADNALGLKLGGEHIGFGAQAVERIIPEAVTRNDKGYLLVNNDPILWAMLNAIKEQQTQIEQQQKQLGELKAVTAENAELRAQLATILTRLARIEQSGAGQAVEKGNDKRE